MLTIQYSASPIFQQFLKSQGEQNTLNVTIARKVF